ncbi:MAG: homocysteine S-methyltransferase family protein, partial [Solobacterium sp.]|nr:homocysteine S-methyltransferase family protein [Solobacterium sp.]
SLIKELKAGTSLPVAVYPNSGETYDPKTKTWSVSGRSMDFGDYALQYMMAGADAVGGCCTTVEKHIGQVVDAKEKYLSMKKPTFIKL